MKPTAREAWLAVLAVSVTILSVTSALINLGTRDWRWFLVVGVAILAVALLLTLDRQRLIGRAIDVRTREDQRHPVTVRPLRVRREPLELTWGTFTRGMELMKEQILHAVPAFEPDMVVGINQAGIIIASALTRIFEKHVDFGAFRLNADRAIVQELLPGGQQKAYRTILVVDTEFKRGSAIEAVVERLKTVYHTANITAAVLVACHTESHHGLLEYRDVKVGPAYFPHFVTFYTSGYIKRPWLLR